MIVPIFIPANSTGGFPFLHILSSSCYCRLFDDGHSDQSDVIPLCSFFSPLNAGSFAYTLAFFFFFGCDGSSCCEGFSLVVASRGYSLLKCIGFSLQ